eukprot:3453574-Rhodomonas_salina.5
MLGCPLGHVLVNSTGHDMQQCRACAVGKYVRDSWDPNGRCMVCPASAQCPNQGPPIFVASSMDATIVLDLGDEDDMALIIEAVAELLGVDPSQVELSAFEDWGPATTARRASTTSFTIPFK